VDPACRAVERGAWVDLRLAACAGIFPGFVVIDTGMIPPGGVDISQGFLPATSRVLFRQGRFPVADIARARATGVAEGKLDSLHKLDRRVAGALRPVDEMDAAIANTNWSSMQSRPDWSILSRETERPPIVRHDERIQKTLAVPSAARRMVERGVRSSAASPKRPGRDRWDQHARLKEGHTATAKGTDKPIRRTAQTCKAPRLSTKPW